LIDAFPISVNQLDLDWSNDNFHKLSVTFAYRYWKNIGAEDQAKEILVVPDNINSTAQTTYSENGVNSVQDRKNQPSYQYVLQQEREAVAAQRGADL
jgi:hypothetical protein